MQFVPPIVKLKMTCRKDTTMQIAECLESACIALRSMRSAAALHDDLNDGEHRRTYIVSGTNHCLQWGVKSAECCDQSLTSYYVVTVVQEGYLLFFHVDVSDEIKPTKYIYTFTCPARLFPTVTYLVAHANIRVQFVMRNTWGVTVCVD